MTVLLQARAGIQIDYGHPIRIPDVQNLIMWTLADGASPQWAFLKVMHLFLLHLRLRANTASPQRALLVKPARAGLSTSQNASVWYRLVSHASWRLMQWFPCRTSH